MHHGGDVRAPQHDNNATAPRYLLLSCMVALSFESAPSEEWTIVKMDTRMHTMYVYVLTA
jgi:hypothetical protein